MGYDARLELRDQRRRRWVGVHTPASVDLLELFTPLLAEEGLDDELDTLLERLPAGASVEARLGPNAVGLVLDGREDLGLVLKRVPASARGPVDALVHVHEGSRARRAHTLAHRLRAYGIGTPRPLGYLERAHRPRSAASLHVSTWVRRPDLRAWWLAHREGGRGPLRARLEQLAGLLRALHAQGLFHADLHAENLLVDEDEILLLDLESIRTVGRRQRVITKSLVRLNRDAEELAVPRSERLRFLAEYVRYEPEARRRRHVLARRIAAGTAHKNAVRAAEASARLGADL